MTSKTRVCQYGLVHCYGLKLNIRCTVTRSNNMKMPGSQWEPHGSMSIRLCTQKAWAILIIHIIRRVQLVHGVKTNLVQTSTDCLHVMKYQLKDESGN